MVLGRSISKRVPPPLQLGRGFGQERPLGQGQGGLGGYVGGGGGGEYVVERPQNVEELKGPGPEIRRFG